MDLPTAPISFEIDPKREEFFVCHKILPEEPLGELNYELSVYEKKVTDRFGKHTLTQLITPIEDDTGTIEINSDDDNHFSY